MPSSVHACHHVIPVHQIVF